jgi:uncharacterized membrane protein YkvA (DUF1232 family)
MIGSDPALSVPGRAKIAPAPVRRTEMPKLVAKLREWARALERDVYALYLASRDPRVSWYAKVLAACVVAYALSPIDLIPDFIPVLGLIDDALILPLGLMLAIRTIPHAVMVEHRATAAELGGRHASWAGGTAIVSIWIVAAALGCWLAWRYLPT